MLLRNLQDMKSKGETQENSMFTELLEFERPFGYRCVCHGDVPRQEKMKESAVQGTEEQ